MMNVATISSNRNYQGIILLIYFHQKYSGEKLQILKVAIYFAKLFLILLPPRKPGLYIAPVYFFFPGCHKLCCSFALAFAVSDKGLKHILWKREKVKNFHVKNVDLYSLHQNKCRKTFITGKSCCFLRIMWLYVIRYNFRYKQPS